MREMAFDHFFSKYRHIQPDIRLSILFHLLSDFFCQKVSWQYFIGKSLSVCSIELGSLPTHRLRDQKSPAGSLRIKGSWVNLYVINMLQFHMMTHGNRESVPCQMWIIGGMFIKAANSSTCKNRISGFQKICLSFLVHRHHTMALLFFLYQIQHRHVFHDRDMLLFLCFFQKLSCNLLPRNVLVE